MQQTRNNNDTETSQHNASHFSKDSKTGSQQYVKSSGKNTGYQATKQITQSDADTSTDMYEGTIQRKVKEKKHFAEEESSQNQLDGEADDEVTVTMAAHDYTDEVRAKTNDSQQFSPDTQTKMFKLQNKLKRLADLGDINTNKQTKIYLDALVELAQINPQVASVLTLI